jgi:polysaccharide biosynthesis protein PelA
VSRPALAVYYGPGELETLAGYQTVVVQPGHFPAEQVRALQQRGVRVLAYLSLGEDDGENGSWTVDQPQTNWHTHMADVRNAEWRAKIRSQVEAARPVFDGFFLDSVEHAQRNDMQTQAMLSLIHEVRGLIGDGYLLANRGLELLARLHGPVASPVNGVLIEGYSCTWEDGYRAYSGHELVYTAALLAQARALGLEVYALDYANTPALAAFAQQRAAQSGVSTFVTNRELSLPAGVAPTMPAQPGGVHTTAAPLPPPA